MSVTAYSKILLVEKSNGDVIELPMESIYEMRFKVDNAEYSDNTPEYVEIVDLGLSVNWASVNLGATTPEEPGHLLAWGELEPKDWYSWSYYKFGTSKTSLTKYTAADGLQFLQPEDDAATVMWGEKWRIPSREEFQELYDNCEVDYAATENGYPGVRFTSKVPGHEGKSIFLCAAGWIQDEYHMYDVTLATYWANECVNASVVLPEFAFAAEFWRDGDYANSYYYSGTYRYLGRPIRAVTPKKEIEEINQTTTLVIECVDGTAQKYSSTEQPKVSFDETTVYVKSELLETEFAIENVERFYFEIEESSINSNLANEFSFYYDGRNVIIEGEDCAVSIFDMNGRVCYNAITCNRYSSIDISGYVPGIYIVKVNNQTIKILKK